MKTAGWSSRAVFESPHGGTWNLGPLKVNQCPQAWGTSEVSGAGLGSCSDPLSLVAFSRPLLLLQAILLVHAFNEEAGVGRTAKLLQRKAGGPWVGAVQRQGLKPASAAQAQPRS